MNKIKLIIALSFFITTCFSLADASALKITDFGAIANDGISDADAIRDTLRKVEQNCGGEIIIPKGEFLLDEAVWTDFYQGCGYIHLTIRGEIGAEIRVSVGSSQIALGMNTLKSLEIKDIVFLGVNVLFENSAFTDAGTVIQVHTVETVNLHNLYFYGLAVNDAIIKTFNSNLIVTDSQFAGSSAYYPNGAYILGDNDGGGNGWQSIRVDNCIFIDYTNYKFTYISKTPYIMTGAYIRTKQPSQLGAAVTRGKLEVKDSMFDEGAHTSITAVDTPYVVIDGVSINLNITTNATGIKLVNVESAEITRSIADWGVGYFLTTQNVGRVKVELLKIKNGAHFWRNLGNTYMVIGYCPNCVVN